MMRCSARPNNSATRWSVSSNCARYTGRGATYSELAQARGNGLSCLHHLGGPAQDLLHHPNPLAHPGTRPDLDPKVSRAAVNDALRQRGAHDDEPSADVSIRERPQGDTTHLLGFQRSPEASAHKANSAVMRGRSSQTRDNAAAKSSA